MTTINLPMPPSLNNSYPTRKNGGRYPSKVLAKWKNDAGFSLIAQRPPRLKGPVRIEYRFEDGGSKADIDNLLKAVNDLLVAHEVIEGDGPKVLRGGSFDWALGVRGVAVTVINLRPQGAT